MIIYINNKFHKIIMNNRVMIMKLFHMHKNYNKSFFKFVKYFFEHNIRRKGSEL